MLCRTVPANTGHGHLPRIGAHVQQHATCTRRVLLAEESHRLLAHDRRAPEVDFEYASRIRVRHALDFADDPDRSVVEHDINAAEARLGLGERVRNVLWPRHVDLDDGELRGGVLAGEVVDVRGRAQGRDDFIACLEGPLCYAEPESGRGAGN